MYTAVGAPPPSPTTTGQTAFARAKKAAKRAMWLNEAYIPNVLEGHMDVLW